MNTNPMTKMFTTQLALMKRELWEHRSFWMVPATLAGVLLFFYLYAMIYVVPTTVGYELFVDRLADADPRAMSKVSGIFLPGLFVPFVMVMSFIITFYLLDALYAERRDRSILFWKSLPVTDTATVMSKWVTLFITIPACTLATVAALSIVINLLTGIFVMFGGGNAWTLVWSNYSFFSGLFSLVVLTLVELLWYAPVFAWLLLASAWAKKAPFLWASLPPLAIMILEEMFFDSHRFIAFVGERLIPFGDDEGFGRGSLVINDHGEDMVRLFGEDVHVSGDFSIASLQMFGELLASPAFWGGLLFAAACTAGAISLRRYRDES